MADSSVTGQPKISSLEMIDITKRFPGVLANDRVTFDVKGGEIHALLGENGAGKSTLMRQLYGLYHPDSGEIRINGQAVTIQSPTDAIARGIGMIHQHFMLVDELTVTENVALGMASSRGPVLDLDKVEARIRALSKAYGLQVDPKAPVWTLAVGERQRVEIIKALYRGAALLILDEIQAGYGRTGSLFAFEQYGVVPDILLLAKGMGGGMPIGAFVAPRAIMSALSDNPILGHITTFGGHPVSCAAALATLETLLESDLIRQVKAKEQLFLELLQHPAIVEVRSAGLWMAVELESFEVVQGVIHHCLERGLVTDWFLFNNRSLRIAPPLIITEEQIRWACGVILEGVGNRKM